MLTNAFNTEFSVLNLLQLLVLCGRRSRGGARSSLGVVSLLFYAQLIKPNCKSCQPQGGETLARPAPGVCIKMRERYE